jgi:hypothetical protein
MFGVLDKSILDFVLPVATICIPLVSAIGICVAIWAIRANRKAQREQTARNAHLRYLELAIAHSALAFPDGQQLDLKNETFNDDEDEFAQYEWFVSFLLSTASYIWESVDRNHPLSEMMRLQLTYHWPYFDYYKDERQYLIIWNAEYRKDILESIKYGKNRYPQLGAVND